MPETVVFKQHDDSEGTKHQALTCQYCMTHAHYMRSMCDMPQMVQETSMAHQIASDEISASKDHPKKPDWLNRLAALTPEVLTLYAMLL